MRNDPECTSPTRFILIFTFWKKKKKKLTKLVAPHYVGGYMTMTFPMKKEYATSMFQIYKPWREPIKISQENCSLFESFVHSDNCPKHLAMSYIRAIRKYTSLDSVKEPVSSNAPHNQPIDQATQDYMDLMGKHNPAGVDHESGYKYDMGTDHEWAAPVNPDVSGK